MNLYVYVYVDVDFLQITPSLKRAVPDMPAAELPALCETASRLKYFDGDLFGEVTCCRPSGRRFTNLVPRAPPTACFIFHVAFLGFAFRSGWGGCSLQRKNDKIDRT